MTLAAPPAPGRRPHLSAASGLVDLGGRIAVIADDELHLGIFRQDSDRPGHLVRLVAGVLADDKPARKKAKPDFEVLTRLPSLAGRPSLLALGSGSTPARCRGVALSLDSQGKLVTPPRPIDFSAFFDGLRAKIVDLNIEGATLDGDTFRLFHRGNNSFPDSVAISLPLAPVLAGLEAGRIEAVEPTLMQPLDLGSIAGVPFSVTDAAALADGRCIVTAVAEDTDSAYADGQCLGALVGLLDQSMRVIATWPLDPPHKVEGVSAALRGGGGVVLSLVADADDPDIAAGLFRATIELRG